jgi:hypothetical protein
MWVMSKKQKLKVARRAAVTALTVWKALPKEQKKQALKLLRKHGPKVAKQIVKARAATKKK